MLNSVCFLTVFFLYIYLVWSGCKHTCYITLPVYSFVIILMLSMLSKNFIKKIFEIFLYFFPRKCAFIVHANCLLSGQFAWNVSAYFLGKIIIKNCINLSSDEFAQRVVKVNHLQSFWVVSVRSSKIWTFGYCYSYIDTYWCITQTHSFQHCSGHVKAINLPNTFPGQA